MSFSKPLLKFIIIRSYLIYENARLFKNFQISKYKKKKNINIYSPSFLYLHKCPSQDHSSLRLLIGFNELLEAMSYRVTYKANSSLYGSISWVITFPVLLNVVLCGSEITFLLYTYRKFQAEMVEFKDSFFLAQNWNAVRTPGSVSLQLIYFWRFLLDEKFV